MYSHHVFTLFNDKMKKQSIPIRWSDVNTRIFKALGYIDGRSGKVIPRNVSFSSFINNIVTKSLIDNNGIISEDKFKKKLKAIRLAELEKQRIDIEKEMVEVARQ